MNYFEHVYMLSGMFANSEKNMEKNSLENINIKKEYELILQKKSTMSARLRREVILRHEQGQIN